MNRLLELRTENNLTQRAIAKLLNVSQGTYNNRENSNTQPSIEQLIQLSRLFKVSIDYIVRNSDDYGSMFSANDLTAEQKKLLELFDTLSPEGKASLLSFLNAVARKRHLGKTQDNFIKNALAPKRGKRVCRQNMREPIAQSRSQQMSDVFRVGISVQRDLESESLDDFGAERVGELFGDGAHVVVGISQDGYLDEFARGELLVNLAQNRFGNAVFADLRDRFFLHCYRAQFRSFGCIHISPVCAAEPRTLLFIYRVRNRRTRPLSTCSLSFSGVRRFLPHVDFDVPVPQNDSPKQV